MAANPISATEIKSRWRQWSSPSLTNNDSAFGVFMKMMDHQNSSFIISYFHKKHRTLVSILRLSSSFSLQLFLGGGGGGG